MPSPLHALLTLAALGLGVAVSAQGTARSGRRLAHDAGAYVPTDDGTAWTWRETTVCPEVSAHPGVAMVSRRVLGTYRLPDGHRWTLVARAGGRRHPTFEHWQTEGPGLLVVATERLDDGMHAEAAGCELAAPVGAVNRWEWTTAGDPDLGTSTATLVEMNERVAVPAGTFDTVHVRIVGMLGADTGEAARNAGRRAAESEPELATTDIWFARGIGVVQREVSTATWRSRSELTAFAHGRDTTAERAAMLQVLAPPAWQTFAATTRVRWLDVGAGSVAFDGRFALVDTGGQRHVAFVGSGLLLALDPAVPGQDWGPVLGASQDNRGSLVATIARAHAARRSMWDLRLDAAPGDHVVHAAGTDHRGRREFRVEADSRNGMRTRIVEEDGAGGR